MYRDLNSYPFRKPAPRRGRTPPKLTRGQQKLLIGALSLELFLLFVAPICGSSIINAIVFIAGSH